MNLFKRKQPSIDTLLTTWSDKEILENFMKFFDRVSVGNTLVQDQNGFYTHQILEVQCGEFQVTSHPQELDWPLEPIVMPDVPKEMIN